MKTYEYETIILKHPDMNATYVIFPFDLRAEFGVGRMKVHVRYDEVPYEGSIVNMGLKNDDGSIRYLIGMPQVIRQQVGKEAGEQVNVKIWPRT